MKRFTLAAAVFTLTALFILLSSRYVTAQCRGFKEEIDELLGLEKIEVSDIKSLEEKFKASRWIFSLTSGGKLAGNIDRTFEYAKRLPHISFEDTGSLLTSLRLNFDELEERESFDSWDLF